MGWNLSVPPGPRATLREQRPSRLILDPRKEHAYRSAVVRCGGARVPALGIQIVAQPGIAVSESSFKGGNAALQVSDPRFLIPDLALKVLTSERGVASPGLVFHGCPPARSNRMRWLIAPQLRG